MNDLRFDRRGLLRGGAAVLGALTPASLLHAQPAAGSTLTIGIPGVPATMDPVNQINHDWMVTTQLIFENLIEFDIDGKLKPQLAAALPTISADGLTYDFTLRPGVTFSNGQPFTAEDVKYSFDYLLNPANRAARRPIFARITAVEVVDPLHVRFTLSEPYAPWLAFMTKCMGIFAKGSREANGPDFFRNAPVGVGTGPAIFEEWRANEYISLRRNPTYWNRGVPAWERLVVRQLPEDATRVAYIRSGQIDIMSSPPPRDFERLKTTNGLQGASRPTLGGWFAFYMDNTKAPFDDVNLRRAVSSAIDRDLIANRVYRGLLDPSAVSAPKSAWWYHAEADRAAGFDLDRAKRFMAASRHAGGAPIEVTIPATPYLLDVRDAALVVQSQLKAIGIDMKIKVMEFGPMIQSIIRGDEPASLWLQMSPGEPTYLLQNVLTPGQIVAKSTNYDSPAFRALLARAFAETDEAKLKPLYAEIQTLLAEDSPMVWIGFAHAANVWRSRVKDFTPNQGLTIDPRPVVLG
ncbi:ABC transporter substrate-binding protein [Roseomonas sp. HJA6]|uniref:ABC transporter substrate-binding protein n=1 Tax=Roseomonas alba TaxID=2846776 RepID=A0ABS7AAC5_9PROT|nr:ABC transporter substrate-binding protein [Neoroseomonas alba]MBW6399256.1 ABC transporter substrate-binding protein [Neoroseomonas alba]